MNRLTTAAAVALLLAACGGGGSTPPSGGGAPTCGALSQTCCATTPACGSGLTCQTGTCQTPPVACGATGQACCAAIVKCQTGLICSSSNVCGVPPPPPCNDPYTTAAATLDVQGRPLSVTMGDLDADGDQDVVVCNDGTTMRILRNDGRGNFTVETLAVSCKLAALGDFNEDGKLDVAVYNGSIAILYGPGPTTAGMRSINPGTAAVTGIAVADFNGDKHLDLAVAIRDAAKVSVYRGVGDGSFLAPVDYAVPLKPVAIAAGDLNGDAAPDLVVTTVLSADVTIRNVGVLINSGTGTFAAPAAVDGGRGGTELRLADFNGDGKLDLAVASSLDDTVDVMLGNGNGTFAAPWAYPTGHLNPSIAVGNFDGTPGIDVVTVEQGSGAIGLLSGSGTGSFSPVVNHPTRRDPVSVAAGDVDGDGKLDLAVAGYSDSVVQIFRNDGLGNFTSTPIVQTATPPNATVAARLNGDAFPDLAFVSTAASKATVLLGLGNGRFGPPASFATGTSPKAIAAGRFNADTAVDLVTANGDGTVSVLLGVGDGKFGAKSDVTVAASADYLAIGDFNRDGYDDLLVGSFAAKATFLLLAKGDGTFLAPTQVFADFGPMNVVDFDGDGLLDFLVGFGMRSYLLGKGDGTFAAPVGSFWEDAIAFGDLNGDKVPDLVLRSITSFNLESYLKGTGANYTFAFSRSPPANFAALALPDADADGFADVASIGDFLAVDLSKGDGTARARAVYGAGYVAKTLLTADLDANGRGDLVIGSVQESSLRPLLSVCK